MNMNERMTKNKYFYDGSVVLLSNYFQVLYHLNPLVIYLTRNLLHHMNRVVADNVYHVNKYVKWSFRKEIRVWPPIGPPGIEE